ncbi:MAG TPA: gephyrin-like molybdotransferase Glp [Chloroflexota bacterium]
MLEDITVEQALGIVLSNAGKLEAERRAILDCLGMVLAEDVPADMDIPPFDNSAMDGYAVLAADTAGASPEHPVLLKVTADLPAGYAPPSHVASGEAVRIMTGAPLPPGTDAIARSEIAVRGDGTVLIGSPVAIGEDVRYSGEDVRKGDAVLASGTPVRPAEIGMLATLGRRDALVVRRPRVAVLATGDELVDPWEAVTPGKIRNSNLYSIAAQVRASGGEPILLGTAKDTAEALESKIREGARADMLITSGGVSVGDYDVVKTVLSREGEILFWKVRMRPGSPVAFGRIGGRPMFGLPGNPTASMVAFEQFVRPAILKMSGRSRLRRREVDAVLEEGIKNRPGVRNFVRAIATEGDGGWRVRRAGEQGSAMLRTMVQSNALMVITEETSRMNAGDVVRVQLLDLPEAD